MWFKNTYRFSPFYKQIINKIPYIKDPKEASFKYQIRIKKTKIYKNKDI